MTEIQLYNTRTRSKEPFEPIDPKNVRMYVCGPTVYDRAHIGNARPVVVFDVLYRLLRHVYGPEHVTYARNFTDVDDRIIDRAVQTKGADETLEAATRRITDETIGWYHEDMGAYPEVVGGLGALKPDHEPRCTEMIPEMVAMTQTLIDKGCAYAAEGHVLFEVEKYPDYGKLARRSLDDMMAGARVEVAPYKRSPMDFVLWKPSTDEQPGWPSPWGRGRPGWHVECSAMAGTLFGPVFDIHGGGIDLAFPHHENEVAQSCCANETDLMANVWMHNGFLQVEGEKMAKSLGNFFTVKDLRDRGIPGEVIRFVLLSAHYRQPIDWTEKRVEEATATLKRWRGIVAESDTSDRPNGRVIDALSDDLNTPQAIAELHVLASNGDTGGLVASANLLGLLTIDLGAWVVSTISEDAPFRSVPAGYEELFEGVERFAVKRPDGVPTNIAQYIALLVSVRFAARQKKRYDLADLIRNGLDEAGIQLKESKTDVEWEPRNNFDPDKLPELPNV
ncbi:MAG: cysteine--tRNA ligase [Paracoccaceae bacterium]|nr:cysteine--tRNA ligase [Paracoccaceae bacterium]